jgi:hypothetical protein
VSFFDGRVPCSRWARVRRNSGHSACMVPQVARLVKGSRSTPANMSCTDARLITESILGQRRIAEPDTCLTDAWYRLTVERNVDTLGLAENSPRQSFS